MSMNAARSAVAMLLIWIGLAIWQRHVPTWGEVWSWRGLIVSALAALAFRIVRTEK